MVRHYVALIAKDHSSRIVPVDRPVTHLYEPLTNTGMPPGTVSEDILFESTRAADEAQRDLDRESRDIKEIVSGWRGEQLARALAKRELLLTWEYIWFFVLRSGVQAPPKDALPTIDDLTDNNPETAKYVRINRCKVSRDEYREAVLADSQKAHCRSLTSLVVSSTLGAGSLAVLGYFLSRLIPVLGGTTAQIMDPLSLVVISGLAVVIFIAAVAYQGVDCKRQKSAHKSLAALFSVEPEEPEAVKLV